jgi:hypothetical protein
MTPVRTPDPNPGWLSDHELDEVRARVPMLYVEAVPVRVEPSGRVMVRDALMRHLEKDLGPNAFPQLPTSTVPFAVTEYFPWPGVTTFSDTRQHAVSLAYVVPVTGECQPRQDALELTWLAPEDAASPAITSELEGGRGALLRQALASVGCLP